MPRIAVVIDPWDYPYNGTVVSTRRFVRALEQQGFEFQLLSLPAPDLAPEDAFTKLSVPGFNGIIDRMRAPLARPDRAKIRRLLEGCELLHVQFPFFLAAAAISEARHLGIPVLASFHVQPENILNNLRLPPRWFSGPVYGAFIRSIYNRADHVLAPSSFAAGLLTRQGLKVPITVLSNGIPERYFEIERDAGRADPLLLSVGRLAREKNQDCLIRAVGLSRHRERIELVLAGVGPREKALRNLAASMGVNARIGWVDDATLLELYGAADVFLHGGAIELEGMAVLEAMAAGNVVVVSDAPESACAAMIHEANARFSAGNPKDLAQRIDYWLDHPEAAASQRRFNRLYARALSHGIVTERLRAVYEEMLGGTVPSGQALEITSNR